MESRALHTGEFYGKVVGKLNCPGFLLSELGHAGERVLPQHSHESAYFSLLLHGEYSERIGARELPYGIFTAVFHPRQMEHRDRIGERGARFFTLEASRKAFDLLREIIPGREFIPEICNSEIRWMLSRLFFLYREAGSPLAIEELSLEILATLARAKEWKDARSPEWLGRIEEFLNEEFHHNIKLEEVAKAARVHPVYLSRVFRRVQRQSVAAYLNQIRVQKASERLGLDATPLASIAADCGFADQSHFTRVFKRVTGATPAEFRRAVQSDQKPT